MIWFTYNKTYYCGYKTIYFTIILSLHIAKSLTLELKAPFLSWIPNLKRIDLLQIMNSVQLL